MPRHPCPSDANISRLSKEQREEIVKETVKEFADSEKNLRDWKTRIITYYELYQMVQRKKHYQGLASIFVPESIRAVETIVGHIYQFIFGQPDWMEYSGRTKQDERPAIALTQLTFYQMEENSFKSRIMDALRQMVIAGLCVRKVGFDYQEVQRTVGQDAGKPRKIWEKIRDTWTLEPVDLLTFHISDINIPYNDVQKATWIGEIFLAKRIWVDEKIRRGWLSDVDYSELDSVEEAQSGISTHDVDTRLNAGGFQRVERKGKFEMIERWGLKKASLVMTQEEMDEEEIDGDDLVETVIVIGNNKALLKLEKNPWWHNTKPYVVCPYIPKEFELPGIGAVQVGESLQEELNDTRNQIMDNKTLNLATMWLKSRTSGIKNQDLVVRPNGVITTNDINGLQALRPPLVFGAGIQIEGVIKNDYRESVGASSNLQGIAQAGVDTATESSIINRQSMGRLLLTAELFSELVLKQVFVMAEYLNYQFYDTIKMIKIVGANGTKWRKLEPAEIAGGHKTVSIKLSLDSTENPAVLRQQFLNFLSIVQPMPPQLMAFHWKLLDKIYSMFFNGHKLDEIYQNPSPNKEDQMSPQDERDMVLAEQGVVAEIGQDHDAYIKYLIKEFDEMKYSLNPVQYDLFKKLIASHFVAKNEEMKAAQEQFLSQQMMAMASPQPQNGSKTGNIINRGTTANMNPSNFGSAPSTESMRKDIGA